MKRPILLLLFITFFFETYSQSQLNFDGYQDHVILNGVDFPPPWTAEVLVLKNEIGAYSHLLTGTDGTSGFRLEQYINNNRIGITSAGIADWSFSYELPLGEWTHLAFVCDGSTMKLFVNGQQTGGNINGTINFPMGMIGLNTTGAGALNSKIDELRIWNEALPVSSISSYMLDSIPNNHPQIDNLVHYYRFDEGSGNIATDTKGNLDGEIIGATYCPIFNNDVAPVALVSPQPFVGVFSSNTTVNVKISNTGLTTINEDFEVSYSVDGGNFETQIVEASTAPMAPFTSVSVSFPPIDLTGSGVHVFNIKTNLNGDENTDNDLLIRTSSLNTVSLQNLTGFSEDNGEFLIESNASKLKVAFYRDDIFRIQLAPAGEFFNPTNDEIIVNNDPPLTDVSSNDEGDYYQISSDDVHLRVYKTPLKFALYNANDELVWEESEPLSFGQQSRQKLQTDPDEQFYGCGMQNGYFSHKGKSIKIENIYGNWADGDVPNPAPFYMSTAGYGTFRNTFERGEYGFFNTADLMHRENHFDAFYFYGPSLKEVLEGYTFITGRPFMIPRWGLEFGDADCYNDTGTTADVIDEIAQKYRDFDLPGGWILPNDGYNCGYEDLEFVVDELHDLGFYTGLWTEDGVGNIDYEVGTAGTRCVKLDVALVGPGYLSAFNSGTSAFNGIEEYSNDRGYVWTVAGWAGTQRFATIWSGDQHGDWENIRFHIPTVIGSGLSAFNCATGDIDGIFSGSPKTYVRDLQWKCFTPAMMTISGWAPTGKQPWAHGGIYTDINRDYLKLKMRLTPYLYSYSREAHETGVPTVRGMVLEFPDDPITFGTYTQYQFMCGESFLVAPIYENTTTRDGIYLPEGTWIDYWDGTSYEGSMTLNGYDAPLEKLPLFVKAGAIIPMYPEMLHDREKPKNPITFDVYPKGNSSFELYEDDGHSQEYKNGAFVKTNIEMTAPENGFDEPIVINVGASNGDYDGKLNARSNVFQVHIIAKPTIVKLNDNPMTEYASQTDWENATSGWYYNGVDKMGTVYVKTADLSVDEAFEIRLEELTLSADEIDLTSTISVSPNPTSGNIFIKSVDDSTIREVVVYSSNGKFLKRIKNDIGVEELLINVTEFGKNILFLGVSSENGTVFRKVIIN